MLFKIVPSFHLLRDRFLLIFIIGFFLTLGFVAMPRMTSAATCHCGGSRGDVNQSGRSCAVMSCTVTGCGLPVGSPAPTCSEDAPASAPAPAAGASATPAPASAPAADAATTTAPPAPPAGGDACGEGFSSYICEGLVFILKIIASVLGQIVLLLLQVLMSFAKYNDFGQALVVQQGWPIVRDLCNMFFIIILLVSAFSTIIDYGGGELHYSKVLPKLLLISILINFSKTLILLLVDFSQVVMLTFVNAFASAAQGNFVNALGLTQVMNISSVGASGTNPSAIIMAYMLAIFMLGIMMSVVAVMTGFLIFRIVGLWIAIILSPLALFMTAVPGKLSKYVSGISSDYWSKLGGMLSGGPIMAFFLWLTLSVVQKANTTTSGGANGMSKALKFETETGSVSSFITSIGNAEAIASFVVGITLLMMGLEKAVTMAQQLSPSLGKFAGQAKTLGTSIGRIGATLPFAATGYFAKEGARSFDKKFRVTQQASTAIARSKFGQGLARTPFVGSGASKLLNKGMQAYDAEIASGAKDKNAHQMETLKRLAPADRDKYVSDMLAQNPSSAEGKKAFQQFSEFARSDEYKKGYQKRREGFHAAKGPEQAKVLAMQDSMEQERSFINKDLAFANQRGDHERSDKLTKEMKGKAYLGATPAERTALATSLAKDPDKYKDIDEKDAMSGEVLTAMMLENGYTVNARNELQLSDPAAWARFKESARASKNKSLIDGIDAHETFQKNSPNVTVDTARNLQHKRDGKDNKIRTYDVSREKTGALAATAGTEVRNSRQTAALATLKTGDTARAPLNTAAALEYMNADGSLAELIQNTNNTPNAMGDLAAAVNANIFNASAALKGGNSSTATQELHNVIPILSDLNQNGVSSAHSAPIIEGFAVNDGVEIISHIDNMEQGQKKVIFEALPRMVDLANEYKKQSTRTRSQEAVVTMVDELVKRSKVPGANKRVATIVLSTSD